MSEKIYDVIIIGGGPAGLSAAIYAGRSNLDTLVIEKGIYGGQIIKTGKIDNYPGGIKGESGADFSLRLAAQAEEFGFTKMTGSVTNASLKDEIKTVTVSGKECKSKAIIIATGNVPVRLNIPGELEFEGRGVSYCATCDGFFFKNKDIYVIGGGDSAVEEAVYLADFGRSVTIIHKNDMLRADKSKQEKASAKGNINIMSDTAVEEIKGEDAITGLVVRNVKTGKISEIKAKEEDGKIGVFIFEGVVPPTEIFEGEIDMAQKYIITDEEMRTNIPGVFAAGDVRKKTLRQVVTAVADGAIAATSVKKYLKE